MRVLVTNTVLLNGGDAAILYGLIAQLESAFGKDVSIVVGETQVSVARAYYPELDLIPSLRVVAEGERTARKRSFLAKLGRIFRWYTSLPRFFVSANLHRLGFDGLADLFLRRKERDVMRQYIAADMVVATGGTYLVEHYRLGPVIFDLNMARLLGRPLVFFTQSLGPFDRAVNRTRLRRLFEHASLILLRDEPSKAAVASLIGENAKSLVVPDAAFALKPPDSLIRQRSGLSSEERVPLEVAISVRFWPNFSKRDPGEGQEVYRSAIAEVTAHLVQHYGAAVTFLSTCQGVTEYPFDDAEEARNVASLLSESVRRRVVVEDAYHRPQEMLERLAPFSFVIATRMHMAILSLIAGKPVLPVAYEFKTFELFRESGMERWVTDIEEIDPQRFRDRVDDFISELDATRVLVRQVVEKQRAAVEIGIEALASVRLPGVPIKSD